MAQFLETDRPQVSGREKRYLARNDPQRSAQLNGQCPSGTRLRRRPERQRRAALLHQQRLTAVHSERKDGSRRVRKLHRDGQINLRHTSIAIPKFFFNKGRFSGLKFSLFRPECLPLRGNERGDFRETEDTGRVGQIRCLVRFERHGAQKHIRRIRQYRRRDGHLP